MSLDSPASVERLALPAPDSVVQALAGLLVDAVDSGAAVSFLAPLDPRVAADWWRRTLDTANPRTAFLVARIDGRIVGTVSLVPAWAPNQPHRAEICKLIVHRDARGRGVGELLMNTAERVARDSKLALLTLDAKGGGAAERLYHRLGWIRVGAIPRFALDPDRRAFHDTVIFYKDLAEQPSS